MKKKYEKIKTWLEEQEITHPKRIARRIIGSRPEIQKRIRDLSGEGKNDAQIATILQDEFGPEGLSYQSVSKWITKNIIRSQTR